MAWINDGVNRDYSGRRGIFYAWGWIGNTIPATNISWISSEQKQSFLTNLKNIADCDAYKGHHDCEICQQPLGSSSKKLKYKNKVYVCPNKVDHYIVSHNYVPPAEVIAAVLNGVENSENKTWMKNHHYE
jgi:hypothetical protein